MPLEAMEHECGWRSSGGDVRVDANGVVTTRRLSRAEVQVYIDQMKAIVKGSKRQER